MSSASSLSVRGHGRVAARAWDLRPRRTAEFLKHLLVERNNDETVFALCCQIREVPLKAAINRPNDDGPLEENNLQVAARAANVLCSRQRV